MLIFMFVLDASLFSSYQVGGTSSLLMGNGSHARVLGVGTVNRKFTLGKTVQLKNCSMSPCYRHKLTGLINGPRVSWT